MQVQLAADLRKLEALYSQHQRGQHRLRDCLKWLEGTDARLAAAEAFEKEHKDVLKAIFNLECSKEFHERNFAPMVYEAEIGSGAKREFPAYRLTRDGFSFLAMSFTGKKAAAWKEKFPMSFNEMERRLTAQGRCVPLPARPDCLLGLCGQAALRRGGTGPGHPCGA